MNKYFLLPALCILLAGCLQGGAPPRQEGSAFESYSNNAITFEYPGNWVDAENDDPAVFLLKHNGTCFYSAAEYAMPLTLFKSEVFKALNAAVVEGGYLRYGLEGSQALTRLEYCDYVTYAFTYGCPWEPDEDYFGEIKCEREAPAPVPKSGLLPYPPNADSKLISQAVRESRDARAEYLSWYLRWGDAYGGEWGTADYLMEVLQYDGGKVIAMVEVIHSSVLGNYPPKFKHFTDEGFKEEFAGFCVDFVERYEPEYFLIGGEVDIYLDSHRDEVNDFKELAEFAVGRVEEARPSTRTGVTVTYHDAVKNNATDIVLEMAGIGDLIVYTSHAYEANFDYDNPQLGLNQLEEVALLVPGKPYAVIETGWSSSELLNSSERKQAEFVRGYFDYLKETDAEFVVFFGLSEQSDCRESAESFLTDAVWATEDKEFMRVFKEFLCSLGLKDSNDKAKAGWNAWLEEVNA